MGREAIKQFWESRIKLGIRDHTFKTGADGRYAYQVAKATVQLVRGTGEKTLIVGHTGRVLKSRATERGRPKFICTIGLTRRSSSLRDADRKTDIPGHDREPSVLL